MAREMKPSRACLFNIQSGPCESRARGEDGARRKCRARELPRGTPLVLTRTRLDPQIVSLFRASPFRR